MTLNPTTATNPISVDDFDFTGPLGSHGAAIAPVDVNHFHITLDHAPQQPQWPNMLGFTLKQNARGNPLRLDVTFHNGPEMAFNHYPLAWSSDERTWHAVQWHHGRDRTRDPQTDTVTFDPFPTDTVHVGTQTPLAYEHSMRMIEQWAKHPHVTVHTLGQSLGGRDLVRFEITDPDSPHPRTARWVHYITHQHPGEQHANWRTIGMVRWLLSDDAEAADCRKRSIFHFLLWMSPDGPSQGWYRVNAQGVDMNRSYRPAGASEREQAHEAYLCQRDLERLMASDAPVTTIWAMHTWQGIVEPLLKRGPEFGARLGPWTEFRDRLAECDAEGLIKPLAVRESDKRGPVTWTGGPHAQFGITAVLCEGASHFTQQQNLDSGESLIRALGRFYEGVRG